MKQSYRALVLSVPLLRHCLMATVTPCEQQSTDAPQLSAQAPSFDFDLLAAREKPQDSYLIHFPPTSSSLSSFSILYDASRRSPKWTVERLKPELGHSYRSGSRRPPFHKELAICDDSFRTSAAMYKNSGYDRGDMLRYSPELKASFNYN